MKKLVAFIKKNSSTILSCAGGMGAIVTAVLSARAAPKVSLLLDEMRENKAENMERVTKLDIVKTAAPSYIPAIVAGAATIGCIFGANVLSNKHQAAILSAYTLVNGSFNDYKRKLKELYGEETHQNIVEQLAIEKANDVHIGAEYIGTVCDQLVDDSGSEPKLFYDMYSKRYFEATPEQVLQAEYHLNRNYILRGTAVLNELYDFLGLEPTDYGEIAGWAPVDEGMFWIEFNHKKVELEDGLVCYILEMPFEPSVDYEQW